MGGQAIGTKMEVEDKLYDEMLKVDPELSKFMFKPAPLPAPDFGETFFSNNGTEELEKRVKQLERNVEDLLAIVERMQDERERIEITYGLEAGEGQTAANRAVANL